MVAAQKKRRRRSGMPEPIPDIPKSDARELLTTPPKRHHEWRFAQDDETGAERL